MELTAENGLLRLDYSWQTASWVVGMGTAYYDIKCDQRSRTRHNVRQRHEAERATARLSLGGGGYIH